MLSTSLLGDEARVILVSAGHMLIVQGGRSDVMFVLRRGQARVLFNGLEVERLAIGDPVGEMSLIDHQPHAASVEAISDCEFVCINEQQFKTLVAETPGFALDLMRTMARRLRSVDRLL